MTRSIVAIACCLLALTAAPALGMSVDDVIDLLDAGVGEAVILDQMESQDARFQLTTDDLILLKRAGATDTLLQAMIAREAPRGKQEYTQDWTRSYYEPSGIRVSVYYDPFGYHWYSWPYYFTYYYPFWWGDCGFYYAGWWSHAWCGWGHRTTWYWDRYHWDRWPVRADGRMAWNWEPAGRYVPERRTYGSQGRIVDRGGAVPRTFRDPTGRSRPEITREGRSIAPRPERPDIRRRTEERAPRPAWTRPESPSRPSPGQRPPRIEKAPDRPAGAPAKPARPSRPSRSR